MRVKISGSPGIFCSFRASIYEQKRNLSGAKGFSEILVTDVVSFPGMPEIRKSKKKPTPICHMSTRFISLRRIIYAPDAFFTVIIILCFFYHADCPFKKKANKNEVP